MAIAAALESVVVHSLQSSQLAENGENCTSSASDETSAFSISPLASEQEDRLRHRFSQAPEAGIQQKDDQQTLDSQEILEPVSHGNDEHRGEALDN